MTEEVKEEQNGRCISLVASDPTIKVSHDKDGNELYHDKDGNELKRRKYLRPCDMPRILWNQMFPNGIDKLFEDEEVAHD